jgi:tungstate transport system substrate-binding protein
LATTTSTQDSGLLDDLLPDFRQQTGIEVKVVAVGSGQALELGRRGDADVLLTHAPAAEEKFMAEGFGSERQSVMYNDFVLAGPKADPAAVQGKTSAVEAFQQIARARSPFISRGDESGTHQKEREIWMKAGVEPRGPWYVSAGTGMAQALRMAQEKQAHVLTDRATFLALREDLQLGILVQGDALLRNRYAVIIINPQKHPHVRHEAARQLADFLVSPETQRKIGDFGKDKYGEALFFPDAHSQPKS